MKTDGEESTTLVFASEGLNHGSMLSSILLARKLAGSPSGEYVFTGIDWGDEDGEPEREPKSQTLTMTVKEAKAATFAGKELEVRRIQGAKQDDPEKVDFVVGTDGRLVSFAPSITPLVFMAADLAGDATAAETVKPGTDSPLAAVALYLKVFTGTVPVTEMNKVMDWQAIHKEMSAADPNIAALGVDALRKILIAEFGKQVGAATAEQVDLLIPMLTVKEDADKATVTMPGRADSPFLLRKTATGWLITRFPR